MASPTAYEILSKSDDDRIEPFLNKIWVPLLGITFGFTTGCAANFATKRPFFSGIQKHILLSVFVTGGLQWLSNHRGQYYAERDAVLRHYVQLHPEDFPMPERVKIGDVFEPWIPVR